MRRAGDLWNACRFLSAHSSGFAQSLWNLVSFPLLEGTPVLGEGQPERDLSLLRNLGRPVKATRFLLLDPQEL